MSNDIRLVVKPKNHLLLSAIERAGYASVGEFCNQNNLQQTSVGLLVNMRNLPIRRGGHWTTLAMRIADALFAAPEDLWSEWHRKHSVDGKERSSVVDSERFVSLADSARTLTISSPEETTISAEEDMAPRLDRALATLSPREEVLLRRRFGFGRDGGKETLDEIGKDWGITRERVRQIESRALAKLRDTSRRKILAGDSPDYAEV